MSYTAMNEHLDEDDPTLARADRELTLGTGAILGIFIGLVLLCGLCFGVGYNMGRKSAPTPLALNDTGSADSLNADTDAEKPAPGSPAVVASAPPTSSAAPAPVPVPRPAPVVRKPALPVDSGPDAENTAEAKPQPAPRTTTAAPSAAPIVRAVPPSALMPSPSAPIAPGAPRIMVQIAAVSHQEDADLLVSALRARGYTVSAHPIAGDNFIHVQVGPFADKKAAEAMRQRLLADGYNAILK